MRITEEEYLEHYGVKGMKWGEINERDIPSKTTKKVKKKSELPRLIEKGGTGGPGNRLHSGSTVSGAYREGMIKKATEYFKEWPDKKAVAIKYQGTFAYLFNDKNTGRIEGPYTEDEIDRLKAKGEWIYDQNSPYYLKTGYDKRQIRR